MKNLLLAVGLLAFLNSYAQSYSSTYEENIFKAIQKDSLQYNFFESLLAIDSTMTIETARSYKTQVDEVIRGFGSQEGKEKKERKRVKEIYDAIHDQFFKKYDEQAFFNTIFENGHYNCVTATALYAYAFEELGVPYHVKETPSHVFLIIYPDTYKIYLETTVPGAYGFLEPKEEDIKDIVDELIALKLVTSQEVSEKGYSKFYENYFYGKEFVDKKALLGMQYYNRAIFAYEKQDYKASIRNLKKAQPFFNSPVVKWMLKEAMYSDINNREMNTKEDIALLMDIIAFSEFKKDYTASNLNSSFTKIVENDYNDEEFIQYVLEEFSKVQNEEVKQVALEYFYEYLARDRASDQLLDESFKYADLLLNINKDSKIAKQIIENVAFQKAAYSNLGKEGLTDFESMAVSYPFIKENNRYNLISVAFYSKISYDSFTLKDIKTGTDYLAKMENLLDTTDVLDQVDKRLISELYVKAGNHYYYQSHYKSAYNIYNKGLSYVPNDADLLKRIGWCKEEF